MVCSPKSNPTENAHLAGPRSFTMPFGRNSLCHLDEIDFAFRFGFAENNSKKIAGCDTRTSNPAIAELRKVQHDNFAPCDSLMLHLATSRYRTLPLSPVAPCDAKSPLLPPKIALRIIAAASRPCLEPPRHRHWPHLPACRADLSAVAFYRAVASAKADGEGGTLA